MSWNNVYVLCTVLLIPFVCSLPIQNGYLIVPVSTYASGTCQGSYTCSQTCANLAHAGAGACVAGVTINSSYSTIINEITTPASYGTTASCPYYMYDIPTTNIFYSGATSCNAVVCGPATYSCGGVGGGYAPYMYCACNYTGLTMTPTVLSTNNSTSIMSSVYFTNFLTYASTVTIGSGLSTASLSYDSINNNGVNGVSVPGNNFHEIQSVAMDTSNNVYFTVRVANAAIGFLYVYQYSGGSYLPAKFTGITACSSVFNNATNVFCIGNAGLIKVV